VVVLPEGWFFSGVTTTAGWTELGARLRRSQSAQLALSRAAVTSVASSALARGPTVGATYQPNQASSVRSRPAASWPRMIASMRE